MHRRGFVALDGIRGVAALAVVTRHATAYFGDSFLFESFLAVDLFFLLSGFVLAHAYELRLRAGLSPWHFMRLRLTRLYPLYLLGTGVGLAVLLTETLPPGIAGRLGIILPLNLLFLPTPLWIGLFPLNGLAWSLFFELVINWVYAIVAPVLSSKTLMLLTAVGFAAVVACLVYFGSLDIGYSRETFVGGAARVVFSFFAGVLLYRVWKRHPPQAWLKIPMWLLLATLVGLFAVRLDGLAQGAFLLAMIAVFFPALVYVAASYRASEWEARVYGALGSASYGIYVLQLPAYWLVQRLWPDLGSGFGALLFPAGLFVACLLIDRVYDGPVRARLTRYLVGTSQKATARGA